MLLRDYFNSFNFYGNGELPRNQIGRSGVQVKKVNENFTVVCSHSHKTLNLVISRCCFAEDIKEMYQNLNVRAERLFLLIEPFALRGCRCRCRCRCHCLSSLISWMLGVKSLRIAVQNFVKMYFSVTSLIF